MTENKLDAPKKEVVVVELTPKTVEDELKELKAENTEMKKILMKLKAYVHPNHQYLYFKILEPKNEKI